MTNDLKLKIYPAVIGVLGMCLVASLLLHVEIQIEQSIPPDGDVGLETEPSSPRSPAPNPTPSQVSNSVPPTPVASPPDESVTLAEPDDQTLPPDGIAKGELRVSNQTDYPLRVALLYQQGADAGEPAIDKDSSFGQPVHWDFVPEEGRAKGLILSLPNGELQLEPGDVLVAFAQDGSRRYWGPYVVGETPQPAWNAATNEWQLILKP